MTNKIDNLQYMLSNGNWFDGSDRTDLFANACKLNGISESEALDKLQGGAELRHRSGDWYALIRIKPAPLPESVKSDKPLLHCKLCGETGTAGAYPFSTLPASANTCDDCA